MSYLLLAYSTRQLYRDSFSHTRTSFMADYHLGRQLVRRAGGARNRGVYDLTP